MAKKIFLFGAFILLALSCSKQMEYNEYNVFDKDYIQSDYLLVGGFITDIYNVLEYDYGNYSGGAMLASASDESEYSKTGNSIEDFYNGAWSATNPHADLWTSMYKGIAKCNRFLTDMQGLTYDLLKLNDDYAQQKHRYDNYQYEARFLRAYFYFQLVRQYGDVPFVEPEMSITEINSLSRAPYDQIFKFIIDECDAIKGLIVEDYSKLGPYALSVAETGRAGKYAVLALKAQAALYWASPLFNPGNDQSRWMNAAKYYKELVDTCEAAGMALTNNYKDLWKNDNFSNAAITKELIFARRVNGNTSQPESYNYPVGIDGGSGGNCPTQNLVDAYDMRETGKGIFEEGSGYNPAKPYEGRDSRLDLTVAVNGKKWPEYSAAKELQTYYGGTNGLPITGATPTGYYLKKHCHGAITFASNSNYKSDRHTYFLYRLGQAYLDYAECVFRALGSADATSAEFPKSARELASKTRVRAGTPAFPEGLGNAEFWEKYKKERMVELAFEGHRFWDVRRWKEADKYFRNIERMSLTKEVDGTITYKRSTVSRMWDDKMYLFPIPQTEIMKNPNLKPNNPGW